MPPKTRDCLRALWPSPVLALPAVFACLLSLTGTALAQQQPRAAEPPSVAWQELQEGSADDYAGAARCSACHRSEAAQFSKTVHARAGTSGCEGCHGPGKAHADAMAAARGDEAQIEAAMQLIFSFHGTPQENSERCMSCHVTSKDQELFHRSEHSLRGLSCNDCHASHLVAALDFPGRSDAESPLGRFASAPRLREETRWLQNGMLKASQPDLCFRCHTTVSAQFALPTHHRVPEGLMKCTDCHNPHGTLNATLLRKDGSETCVNCHIEKRGPFVFEHAAVRVEGCVACHTPHGSVNRALLVRREGRFLCLQCHVDPFAANVPHGRFGFPTRGECVRCHVAIHGSNSSEFFLQ